MVLHPSTSRSIGPRFLCGVAVLLLLCASPAPVSRQASAAQSDTTAETVAAGGAAATEITIDAIIQELQARVDEVRDVTAIVSFYQVSPRDGNKTEGRLRLAAIFPDLIRTTVLEPEFSSGVFFIVDAERNLFAQYAPATGEARQYPLDEVLSERSSLPIQPEELFTLPPREHFDLHLVDVVEQESSRQAIVEAIGKEDQSRYRVRVDLDRWLVTQVQQLTADGEVELSAEAHEIVVNQGLSAALLRRLPEGTIEKSYR